jgi:outer membrane protein assembly factor BamB
MKRSLLCSTLLLLLFSVGAFAETDGDRLIEAVRDGNNALAKELIEKGADVNAKTRYGATPLFFACDKGNVELVKLLIQKGADVSVVDTFYGVTPVTWVLFSVKESEPHREILGLLLAEKPDGAASALPVVAEMGDRVLAELIVASESADAKALEGAIEIARGAGHEELAAYLEEQLPEGSAEARFELSPEVLERYLGDYVSDETGSVFRVYVEDGVLKAQGPGEQPPLTLDPESEVKFNPRQAPEIAVEFRGEGERAGQLVVLQPEGEIVFKRKVEVTETEAAAEALSSVAIVDLPEPKRTAPRPWPAFRGADNSGVGDGQDIVAEWDGPSGKNILWKTPIPGLANSSPIIWGDKVFVTTASTEAGDESLRIGLYGDVDSIEDTAEHTWSVYALDEATGDVIWTRAATTGVPKVKRHLKSTHANSTPATDGKHVVASFGSEGVYCYDFDGNLLWQKDLGLLRSGWFYDPTYEWGFGSSPIIYDGKVILQVDRHEESYITALDVTTGRELWKTDRDEISTWGTPVILPGSDGGPPEIVTNGPTVRGYDANTGELLWWIAPNSEITVASPVVGDNLAYITGGYPPARPVYAIRPGGRGDLSLKEGESSSEAIAWSLDKGGAYMPTPIVHDGILYVFHGNGRLATYDAETGESIYKERVGSGNSFSGSPVIADGRLYFTSESGDTFVVRAGRDFQMLGQNSVDEVVMSTPAISDGLMVIRAKAHVYGIGEAGDVAPSTSEPSRP